MPSHRFSSWAQHHILQLNNPVIHLCKAASVHIFTYKGNTPAHLVYIILKQGILIL